jgi:two-component sensor histidine kinase
MQAGLDLLIEAMVQRLRTAQSFELGCSILSHDLRRITQARRIALVRSAAGRAEVQYPLAGPLRLGDGPAEDGMRPVDIPLGADSGFALRLVGADEGALEAVRGISGRLGHLVDALFDRQTFSSRNTPLASAQAMHAALTNELASRQSLFLSEFGREDVIWEVVAALWQSAGPSYAFCLVQQDQACRLTITDDGRQARTIDLPPQIAEELKTAAGTYSRKGDLQAFAEAIGVNELSGIWLQRLSDDGYVAGSVGLGMAGGDAPARDRQHVAFSVFMRMAVKPINWYLEIAAIAEAAFLNGARDQSEHLGMVIHDTALQNLTYARLQVGRLRSADEHKREQILAGLDQTLDEATRALRGLSVTLTDQRADVDLEEATQELLSKLRARADVRTEILVEGRRRQLGARVSSQILESVGEILTNVWKHARAARVTVRYEFDPYALRVEVADDGVGFDPNGSDSEGLGLPGTRRRLARLGGQVTIESAPGSGTRVRLEVPV